MARMSKPQPLARSAASLLLFALLMVQFVGQAPTPATAQTQSYVRLKNKWQGVYLYESANQVRYGTPAASDTSSHWLIEDFQGSKRIKNRATANYMAIEHLYDAVESIPVQDTWLSARWTIEDAPAAGYKVIRSAWRTWEALHIENLHGYAQHGDINTSWDSPQWLIEPVSPSATATPTPTSTPAPTSTPTATPPPAASANLALNKPITASSSHALYPATNANDGNLTTYWEGAGSSYPNQLTVSLGANGALSSVVVKLNPDAIWSTRTQTIEVLGREQSSSTFVSIGAASTYTFNPAAGNSVTIPVSATVADVRLAFTSNSGALAGQVAEFQVIGTMASTSDPGPDLQVLSVSTSPYSPAAGTSVSFVVAVNNRGATDVAAGTTTRVAIATTTLTTITTPAIPAGATVNVTIGTWTAVSGSTPLTATADATGIVAETNESNNTFSQSIAIGRGAMMPYTRIEAESAGVVTNGTRLTPNYHLADFAGEASGRSAVLLDTTGEYVEFTLPAATNAIVVRNAISNSADGAGLDATLSIYAAGSDKGNLTVSSRYSYVYASPTTLGNLGYENTPIGTAYWLYEEANMLLDQVYPAGTKLRLQKDSGDVAWIYIDFLEVENVAPPASNPDSSRYVEVSATKSIDAALQEFRADSNKLGIFIPAGNWPITSKISVYGRATQIIGAGPWHTRLMAPQDQTNTDVGFNIAATANGSVVKNFSVWGNYRYRMDGPGKFIDGNGMQSVTVQNIWAEHFVCLYWGVNSSNNTFRDLRIRNTFADGINMTNGSSNNLITNSESRGAGDDAFALFSAVDAGGSYNVGNQYTNLTAILVRRAAAFAVYGGSGNLYQNLYGADTLTYPGITISSLSFGINTLGFGDQDNVFDGITLERTGGDFWTSAGGDDKINDYQNFAAIWFFAGDRPFRNIVVKNVDINNPVYSGVMFQTKYPEKLAMQNVRLENITINGAPRYGIKLVIRAEGTADTPPVGAVSFTNVQVNNAGVAAIYGEGRAPEFTVNRVSGNNW